MAEILGIDVSEFQGKLDWQKIKAAGVRFAIIRGGYGRYAVDGQFYNNIQGAINNGIPVGVYWFSYALCADGAREEAQKCLSLLSNYDIQLPVFYDFEYDTVRYAAQQGITLGRTQFNEFALAFLNEVESRGYRGGIYYNLDYYRTMVDTSLLGQFVQWYAQYAAAPDIQNYAIWQFSSTGLIPGISVRFDMDLLKDASLLDPEKPKTGWQKNDKGWWYVREDGTYPTAQWEKIGSDWYYFDKEGYMMANQWQQESGNWYYLGADGAMVTNSQIYLDASGKMVPMEGAKVYHLLRDVVDPLYLMTLEKLIALGVLKGRGGSGEDLILDLTEDSVRLLVMLDRAGTFE